MKYPIPIILVLILVLKVGPSNASLLRSNGCKVQSTIYDEIVDDPILLDQGTNSSTTSMANENSSDNISPEDLAEAKSKLLVFLGELRGIEALNKIMEQADKSANGRVGHDELVDFLKHINLGNSFTRDIWAQGLLDNYGTGQSLNRVSGKNMLEAMDLF